VVLAPFPTTLSVVVAFVLAQHGPQCAWAVLGDSCAAWSTSLHFCFLLSLLIVPAAPPIAFSTALCGATSVQLLSVASSRLRRADRRRPALNAATAESRAD
jgi:hypothetical protein